MPYRPTENTERRRVEVRSSILKATQALLREGGYAAAGIDEIAARAGIASGTVYRHFETKAELFAEVFRILSEREVSAMAEALHWKGRADDRIAKAIEVFARRALKGRRVAYALIAEPVDVAVDKERLVFRRAYVKILSTALKQGISRGELPLQDPDLVAAALVGALGEALLGPLSKRTRGGDEIAIRRLVAFCRRAITGRRK
jgi:AcrR family transcriptional regulator